MIEGSREAFDLSVFCGGASPNVATEVVPDSTVGGYVNRIPVLRRLRDWATYISDSHFDRYVSSRISPAKIFQGVTGQCEGSLKAAKTRGCRTLLDVVTMHIDDFGAQQDRECLKFQVRPSIHPRHRQKMRAEYERADVIRVMSERARQTFLERGSSPDRVVVISPPINLDEFPQANFSESKFRISFVGLLEPWKGFHYLIEAFNALNLPESELVFWGGSGTRSVSQYLHGQMARNPAIILKPVEVRRLGYGEVYGKSSVFVNPSLADGFGYVVAEAMASGLPVIVTSRTGAADLIVDGENGYIVPPADIDAIRDRLAHLASHPALLREMGHAARETASSLTFEKFRGRYVSCLQALAA
jgi:alpha-maltose-1-phosphate synthase